MCVHIWLYAPKKERVLKFEKLYDKKNKQIKKVSPGPLECPPEHSPEDEREVVVGGRDEEQRRADLVVDEREHQLQGEQCPAEKWRHQAGHEKWEQRQKYM